MGHRVKRPESCVGEDATGAMAKPVTGRCPTTKSRSWLSGERRIGGSHEPDERLDEPVAESGHCAPGHHERGTEGLGLMASTAPEAAMK